MSEPKVRKTAAAPGPGSFTALPFFVLRTPLLSFDTFREWGAGLACTSASPGADLSGRLAEDRVALRARLARILERPDAREAVYVASPSLSARLAKWEKDPEGKDGQKIEQALVRYVTRMTGRPTPFGLFSGCSLGQVSAEADAPTRLVVEGGASDRRCARLDFSYLTNLAEAVEKLPGVGEHVTYVPNTGIYRTGAQLHFTELVHAGSTRRYTLSAVEAGPALDAVLARARGGATIAELGAVLVDADTTREEAEAYVAELVRGNVLESTARPPITVADAARAFARDLAPLAPAAQPHRTLTSALDRLDALNGAPLGQGPEPYDEIARELEALPAKVTRERLFQVDMMRRSPEATLGPATVAAMERAVGVLHHLFGASGEHGALQSFARAFAERYEGREVPLLEALDEELGIGFTEPGAHTFVDTPLLGGLPFPTAPSHPSFTFGPVEALLARKMEELRAAGGDVLEITDADLDGLGARTLLPMPDSFSAVASLLAPAASGDFGVHLHYAAGPSGARMLGRFCGWDEALTANVRELLKDEESRRPDAIFAEVVFQPQASRVGNLLLRPPMREHEIVFHARSGVAGERQIPLDDLDVSVAFGRITLRSRSRGRVVVPRLTSAHNFASHQLGAYRFLCRLQDQGTTPAVAWSWSFLSFARKLPRVVYGRVVLSPAMWRLDQAALTPLRGVTPAERFGAVTRLRQAHGLPRFIALHDGDNVLPVDLDNSLSVDAFVDLVHDRSEAKVSEALDQVRGAVVEGPGGGFVHELIVPMASRATATPRKDGVRNPARAKPRPIARDLAPGSPWLYAKLYGGQATADEVLAKVVRPLVDAAVAADACDHWFFIRYADPGTHLRVRLHGDPARLVALLPELETQLRPWLQTGQIWRYQLDTYAREIERYGGDVGLPLCEKLFGADTEAAMKLLALLAEEGSERDRWQWTLLGIDALLADFGYDVTARHRHELRRAEGYAREFRMQGAHEHALGKLYRLQRATVDMLLAPGEAKGTLARAREILAERSVRNRPIIDALRAASRAKQLTSSIDDILGSVIHMSANRMLRSFPRQQELVLHTFLTRTYESVLARERKKTGPRGVQGPEGGSRTRRRESSSR